MRNPSSLHGGYTMRNPSTLHGGYTMRNSSTQHEGYTILSKSNSIAITNQSHNKLEKLLPIYLW